MTEEKSDHDKIDEIWQREQIIPKYWPVAVTIVTIVLAGAVGLNEIDTIQAALADTQDDVEELEDEKEEVKEKLVEIETKQETIREDVEEVKDDVKRNSEKLDEILRRLPRSEGS